MAQKELFLDVDATQFKKGSAKLRHLQHFVAVAALVAGAAATASANVDVKVDPTSAAKGVAVSFVQGTPVVDIAAADKNGVSDNRFTTFSTSKGVVFKNNTIELHAKSLKQKLAKNPNLKESVKTVLAQVTGNSKSVVKGTLEVLGGKADVLVVNPSGLELNGVNLVNVKDFTATTAQLTQDANNLVVTGGTLEVTGDLTTDDVNLVRLIAEAVKVKAKVAPSKNAKGKKADVLVAGGKGKFNTQTNTQTKLDDKPAKAKVAISGSALGAMHGDKVRFLVTETGAGVNFEGNLFGEQAVEVTADGNVKVNSALSKGKVELTSKSGDVNLAGKAGARTQDQTDATVAAQKVTLKGKNVVVGVNALVEATDALVVDAQQELKLQKDAQLVAPRAVLAAQEANLKEGQVKADTLLTKLAVLDASQLKNVEVAKKFGVKFDGVLKTQADFAKVAEFQKQSGASEKDAYVDAVEVAEGTTVRVEVENLKATNFTNRGVLSFVKNVDLEKLSQTKTENKSTLVVVDQKFENTGLLVADNLGVAAKETVLGGNVYTLGDLAVNTDSLLVNGTVVVNANASVVADEVKVAGELKGELALANAATQELNHNADHHWRRDNYDLTLTLGKVDGSKVKVEGGVFQVVGDLDVKGQDGNQTNFDLQDGDVAVGGTVTVDGALTNQVTALQQDVLSLFKQGNKVTFKFQPRTWSGSGLMVTKTQEFDSVYDFLESAFKNNDKFSWWSGAYKVEDEYLFDTLKATLQDAYYLQAFAHVFGADWRKQDVATLKQRWEAFKAQPTNVTVYSPAGNFQAKALQVTNGDFQVGVADDLVKVNTQELGTSGFAVTVGQAGFGHTKLTKGAEKAEVSYSEGEQTKKVDVSVNAAQTDLKDAPEFKKTTSLELVGTNEELALQVLDLVTEKTGQVLFQTKSRAQVLAQLVKNYETYTQKVQEVKDWYAQKIKVASEVGKKLYTEQYNNKLKRLAQTYDYVTWEQVGAEARPVFNVSKLTAQKARNFKNAAAQVSAREELSVQNANQVSVNNGQLTTGLLKVKAKKVNFVNTNGGSSVEATQANLEADNYTQVGNASFGNKLELLAKQVQLAAAHVLDDSGYSWAQGRLDADQVKISADTLDLKGFTVAGKAVEVAAKDLTLAADYSVTSSLLVEGTEEHSGTKQTNRANFIVTGSALQADKLKVTADNLALQSSSLKANDNLEVEVKQDFTSTAAANFEDVTVKEERTEVNGSLGFDFAGYRAEIVGHLASNDGKPTSSPKAEHTGVTHNGPTAGLSLYYSASREDTTNLNHANSDISAKEGLVKVGGVAEIGNLDFNREFDPELGTGKVKLEAASVTSTNQEDKQTRKYTENTFSLDFDASASSQALEGLATTVQSATAEKRGLKVDPTVALQVASNVESLIVKPLGSGNFNLGLTVGWKNEESTTTQTSRNNYSGSLEFKVKDKVELTAVDGEKLSDFTVRAKAIEVTAGKQHTEESKSSGKFNLKAEGGAYLDPKSGINLSVTSNFGGEGEWTKTTADRVHNSLFQAKNVHLEADDIKLTSATFVSETANVKADLLSVESELDQLTSVTHGFNLSGRAGASYQVGGGVTPVGNVNVGYKHHRENESLVAEQAGFNVAKTFNVEAENAVLTGSSLISKGAADFNILSLQANNLKSEKHSDGGSVSLGFWFGKEFNRATIGGGRDEQEHYVADELATVAGGNVVGLVNGELNTDASKATKVSQDDKVEATRFEFAASKADYQKLKDAALKLWHAPKNAVAKIKGTHSYNLEKDGAKAEAAVAKPEVTEAKPEAKPEASNKPAEPAAKPAAEAKPAEVKPAAEAKPTEVKPAAEAKPAADAKPASEGEDTRL